MRGPVNSSVRWTEEIPVNARRGLRRDPRRRRLSHRTSATPATCNAPVAGTCDAEGVCLRCLIVDDNAPFLEAAASLLEREGIEVVGVASTGDEALRHAQELRPDVALVDILL